MLRPLIALILIVLSGPISAQSLQDVLQEQSEEAADPGRRTVGTLLDALIESDLPGIAEFLSRWQDKEVWQRSADGLFFYGEEIGDDQLTISDISTDEEIGTFSENDFEQVKPNGGVRRVVGGALVQFQLSDPDPAVRREALEAIARRPDPDHLEPLVASIDGEENAFLRARKQRLADILRARFGKETEARVTAIQSLSGDVSVETRAVLNQILATEPGQGKALPEDTNIARELSPGSERLSRDAAYARLVSADLAPELVRSDQLKGILAANLEDGAVGGVPVEELDSLEARDAAYDALSAAGRAEPFATEADRHETLANFVFWDAYVETDAEVTGAARTALLGLQTRLALGEAADLSLDALSLASIYFLAAIGLAITFGVMGVINMAHGEFIMMGAYTGYVVQQYAPNYTISLIVALPSAFAVTFAAGVAMERLVIRHLYHRPLETLLATFGISIALQQLAKNIFGTQARPLTAPGWLDGSWAVADMVSISFVRIAIFGLALIFLVLLLLVLNRTRLGLEVRAVTQNRGMAGSMGIDPDRVNMLTFGLGSGIAGIAGVAIGLYAQVTSEMGQNYIVQSFMTVVVGGVGNVWGTLAGAALIGFFQKGIEWFNPSNTLAAQTYMILVIILFIQFRPRGIVALKGRAAGV